MAVSCQCGFSAFRFIAASALAAVGFVAAWQITAALAYGTDTHAMRIVGVCLPLFVGGLIAFDSGAKLLSRIAGFALGIAVAAAAWLLVPCEPGGLCLRSAIAKHQTLKVTWTALPAQDSFDRARELKQESDSLVRQYPKLAGNLEGDISRWATEAAEVHAAEVRAIHAMDTNDFNRTAPARHALVEVFPEVRVTLIMVEARWAEKSAHFHVVAYTHDRADLTHRQIREGCHDTEKQLLELNGLDASPGRYLEARRHLFVTAHEAAEAEIRKHIEAGQHHRTFTVALQHHLAWTDTADNWALSRGSGGRICSK